MALALANKDATYSCPRRFDTTGRTTYTTNKGGPSDTGSFTPGARSLLIASIVSTLDTTGPTSVSGNGVTYTYITGVDISTTGRLEVWAADSGASPSAGSVSATWADARDGAGLIVAELTGADLSGGVAAAFAQALTNSGTGTSGSVDALGHFPEQDDNRPVGVFAHLGSTLHSLTDSRWVEFHDASYSTPSAALQAQWREDAFDSPSTTWTTSAAWGGIGLEVKASGAITGVVLTISHSQPAGLVAGLSVDGVVLAQSPSLPTASLTTTVEGAVLAATPSLPSGSAQTTVNLGGVVLAITPSAPAGVVHSGDTGGYLGGYTIYGYLGQGQDIIIALEGYTTIVTVEQPAGGMSVTVEGVVLAVTPSLDAGNITIPVYGVVLDAAASLPSATILVSVSATALTVTPTVAAGSLTVTPVTGGGTGKAHPYPGYTIGGYTARVRKRP